MDQLKIMITDKRLKITLGLLIGILIVIEVQSHLLLHLMHQLTLPTKTVLVVEAIIFIAIGVATHWAYRKYLSQRSFVKTSLSDRELEVFYLLIQGKPNPEIMASLFIEKSTLKTHINRIYKKLNVSDREELMRLYSA